MNHILRDIKLSKLTGMSLSKEASRVVKFWDKLWVDMKVQIDAEKGEIKCWKDECCYYFIQDNRYDYMWCDFENVWSFFRHDLDLNYNDTHEFIQYMVSETLNCRVNTLIGSYYPR